jgi:hypothetical protein
MDEIRADTNPTLPAAEHLADPAPTQQTVIAPPAKKKKDGTIYARAKLTEERWQKFLEVLRATGSMRYAAQCASAHIKSGDYNAGGGALGVNTFREAIKRDPIKREQYQNALDDGIAALEKMARDRCSIPDRRPILNPKTGEIIGYAENWMAANGILMRQLERHDDAFAVKKNISGQITNTNINVDGGAATAPGYLIRLDDIEALSVEQRNQLGNILRTVENHRLALEGSVVEPAQAALPEPPPTQAELGNE